MTGRVEICKIRRIGEYKKVTLALSRFSPDKKAPLCWSRVADPRVVACKRSDHDGGIVFAIILDNLQIDNFLIQSLSRYATAPFTQGGLFVCAR